MSDGPKSIWNSGNGSGVLMSPASRTARWMARIRSGRSGWAGPVLCSMNRDEETNATDFTAGF